METLISCGATPQPAALILKSKIAFTVTINHSIP